MFRGFCRRGVFSKGFCLGGCRTLHLFLAQLCATYAFCRWFGPVAVLQKFLLISHWSQNDVTATTLGHIFVKLLWLLRSIPYSAAAKQFSWLDVNLTSFWQHAANSCRRWRQANYVTGNVYDVALMSRWRHLTRTRAIHHVHCQPRMWTADRAKRHMIGSLLTYRCPSVITESWNTASNVFKSTGTMDCPWGQQTDEKREK